MPFTTILDASTLQARLGDPDWVVFDVRHDLGDPAAGELSYRSGHLPGARFLHLDRDLSGVKTGGNGRHPLPPAQALAARLAGCGVGPRTQVVAYDAHGGAFAARLWWLLRWIGHEAVAVLDGGVGGWLESGFGLDCGVIECPVSGGLEVRASLAATVDVDCVAANLESRQKLIVDARSPDRFRGENETMDPVGGHIPGAVNHFFRLNLESNGRFKLPEKLRKDFRALLRDFAPDHLVAQCGSGVTACHNLLAMEVAGLPGAALYPGSWSEWCSDRKRPVSM